jgi:tRNA threonylcarbamoyladenosine biosynthesis protein TsaB
LMTKYVQILAIETATSSCSVALSAAGQVLSRTEVGSNIHSQVVLQMVREVLDEAELRVKELEAVAVGQGPGSFTGLRIGVGVAQGIAYGAACSMIGVSSLDALANQAAGLGPVIAAIDARMGEVYWCEYIKSAGTVTRQCQLQVSAPQRLTSVAQSDVQLVGNAWEEYKGQFNAELLARATVDTSQVYPSAVSMLELAKQSFAQGHIINPVDFAPEYVRNNVAKKSVVRKTS